MLNEPDSHLHGWSRIGQYHVADVAALHIGRLPNRKGVALYEANGSVRVLAWFADESAAHRAVELIDHLIGLKNAQT